MFHMKLFKLVGDFRDQTSQFRFLIGAYLKQKFASDEVLAGLVREEPRREPQVDDVKKNDVGNAFQPHESNRPEENANTRFQGWNYPNG